MQGSSSSRRWMMMMIDGSAAGEAARRRRQRRVVDAAARLSAVSARTIHRTNIDRHITVPQRRPTSLHTASTPSYQPHTPHQYSLFHRRAYQFW